LIAGLHSAYSQLQTVLLCMKDVTVDDVESALIGAQGLASRQHHTVSDALFVRRQGSASGSASSGAATLSKHEGAVGASQFLAVLVQPTLYHGTFGTQFDHSQEYLHTSGGGSTSADKYAVRCIRKLSLSP